MLKKDLIKVVVAASGHPESTVRAVLDAITTSVLTALAGGTSVMLLGLGKLSITRRGPKQARNIRTGESVVVPPRNVVTLRPSDAVNDAVNAAPQA